MNIYNVDSFILIQQEYLKFDFGTYGRVVTSSNWIGYVDIFRKANVEYTII